MNNSKKNVKKVLYITLAVILVLAVASWCIYGILSYTNADGELTEKGALAKAFKINYLLAGIFIITAFGYLLGSISVKGVSLGTAGVFLVAILFGYLCTLPQLENLPILSGFYMANTDAELNVFYDEVISNVGLVLFVTSVGFIAGPNFFKNLKKNAKSFVLLGAIIIFTGAVLAVIFALIPGISPEFSTGVLSGALTTTPGFSAAVEAAKELGHKTDIITMGHAVAYPFGVIGVVLFVQLIPKFMKADMKKERELLKIGAEETRKKKEGLFECDPFGLTPFALAVIFGLILGAIKIPLSLKGYNGPCFSLGTTGGTLIMALIFGHFGNIGKISLEVPEATAKVFREFGLMLFLIGAGVSGGVSLVSEITNSDLGVMIVVYGFIAGVIMTIVPMIVGFFVAKYALKLSLLNNLGSITGGMTSTPALGTLINTAKTDDVAGAYASTYPIALVLIVLASQLIVTLMSQL